MGYGLSSDDAASAWPRRSSHDRRLDQGAVRAPGQVLRSCHCRSCARAPVQRPHPPIWRSVVSPPSFAACGERGVPILTVRLPNAQIERRLGLYAQGLEEAGLDAAAAAPAPRRSSRALAPRLRRRRAGPRPRTSSPPHSLHTRQHMNHARDEPEPARTFASIPQCSTPGPTQRSPTRRASSSRSPTARSAAPPAHVAGADRGAEGRRRRPRPLPR